jgi:hypothetical protein
MPAGAGTAIPAFRGTGLLTEGEKMKKIIILTACLILIILGCTLESQPPEITGSLNLTVSDNEGQDGKTIAAEGKTIVPPVDMDASAFDIYGAGPGGRSFNRLDIESSKIHQMSLVPGEWAVTVNAMNKDGVIIGTGSVKAVINAGKITRTRVFVCPVHGEGTLGIQVIWPPDILRNPSVKAEITPAGGTPLPLHFIFGCSLRSAFYSGSFQSGYYTLSVQLFDGDEILWGTVEAVRIIAGEKTCKIFVLIKDM